MHLPDLFPNEEPITFVCDNPDLIAWIQTKGFVAINAKDLLDSPKNAVVIHSDSRYLSKIDQMVTHSLACCVLSLNQFAFDPSFEALRYSCERLLEVDFRAVFAYQKELLTKLENFGNPFILQCKQNHLTCYFVDNVYFAYPHALAIQPGKPRNVNEYLEFHFENLNDSFAPCFRLEGDLLISSILYAVTPSRLQNFSSEKLFRAQQLFEKCIDANLFLKIKNNKVTSFKMNEVEYADELYFLAGKKKGLEITEFAFGLNKKITHNINRKFNSQLNEGIEGIHVGIGDGSSGIHLDFICTDLLMNAGLMIEARS